MHTPLQHWVPVTHALPFGPHGAWQTFPVQSPLQHWLAVEQDPPLGVHAAWHVPPKQVPLQQAPDAHEPPFGMHGWQRPPVQFPLQHWLLAKHVPPLGWQLATHTLPVQFPLQHEAELLHDCPSARHGWHWAPTQILLQQSAGIPHKAPVGAQQAV